jgi:hypothetical protein
VLRLTPIICPGSILKHLLSAWLTSVRRGGATG